MDSDRVLSRTETFEALPPVWREPLMEKIQSAVTELGQKVVILDDDPTGTQTAHHTTVITGWSRELLKTALQNPEPALFVMHNSRAMIPAEAERTNRDIAENLAWAAAQTQRPIVIISRSDSTLRGHFPLETDILADTLQPDVDGVLIIPAFMAGERYTLNDIHYVAQDNQLIPAAQTAFAQDAAFGYRSSNLRKWIAEKTNGRVLADAVSSISLAAIRQGGPGAVQQMIMGLFGRSYCVVNAITERDLEVVALACIGAESQGKRLLYRSAASFATIRAGIEPQPPLDAADLNLPAEGGGLIVVGSYVPKTTAQLNHLLNANIAQPLRLPVEDMLNENRATHLITKIIAQANDDLTAGKTVVIYTSRDLITADTPAASLAIGGRVSACLVDIVKGINAPLRYVLAKGGITSSDIATKALNIQQARVRGQLLAGIPVWQALSKSPAAGLNYIVFPGNVGDDKALLEAVQKLSLS